MANSNAISRRAVVLAAASVLATSGLYSLALVPLLFPGTATVIGDLRLVLSVFVVFLGVTAVRSTLAYRLAPHDQAFVRFWALAPFFTFLVAFALGSVPILLAFSGGPALGWSPTTLGWVLRAIALVVLVFSALFVLVLWRRHQASLQNSPPSPGARAA